MRRTLHLQVVIDLICPWCFIGKRSLATRRWFAWPGRAWTSRSSGCRTCSTRTCPTRAWTGSSSAPCASAGKPRSRWTRARSAGKRFGASFDYAKQARTSSTVTAHALVRLAQDEGGAALQERLVDALFVAYFEQGQDIGDHAVLERVAQAVGLHDGAVQRALPGRETVRARAVAVLGTGLNGVPSYLVDGKLLWSGSQDVAGYVQRLAAAALAVS